LGIQSQQPTGLTQQVDTLEKEPKQNYLPYYNRRHGRYGVLWADRLRAFCSKGVRLWPQWLLISNSTRFVPVFVPDLMASLWEVSPLWNPSFYKLKHKLGYQRRCPATRLTALGCADTLWVFRDLRIRPIG
jgi:hypothetical protein